MTNQIPTNWKFQLLGELFDIKRGGSPRPIERFITNDESGLNWLRIGDIDKNSKFIKKTTSKIIREGLSKTTLVRTGDFILSNSMSYGRPYILNIDTCIHDGWLTFQNIKIDKLNRFFLYYLLLHPKTQNEFTSIAAGSGVQNLKKETVFMVSLLFPPLAEQERIVAVLETWDEMLEKLARKIELKQRVKRGLMQQLLTGERRLAGFIDEWKAINLGSIGTFSKGSGITKAELSDSGFNAIRYGELYTKHDEYIKKIYSFISEEVSLKTKLVKYGDIVFAGSGETIDDIGKSAAYLFNEVCYAGGDIIIFSPKQDNSVFLGFLLNSKAIKSQLRKLGQGQSVVHIYKKDLERLEFNLPPLAEQSAIAAILTTADEEIEALQAQLVLIEKQKQFLLNQLVTGELRTPEDLMMLG